MSRKYILPFTLVFLLVGCAQKPLIDKFEFRMTKDEVAEILDEPLVSRGVTFNRFGQMVEVFEFDEYEPEEDKSKKVTDTTFAKPRYFYLFFYKNQLVLWGESDDWRESAKVLYNTKFW